MSQTTHSYSRLASHTTYNGVSSLKKIQIFYFHGFLVFTSDYVCHLMLVGRLLQCAHFSFNAGYFALFESKREV